MDGWSERQVGQVRASTPYAAARSVFLHFIQHRDGMVIPPDRRSRHFAIEETLAGGKRRVSIYTMSPHSEKLDRRAAMATLPDAGKVRTFLAEPVRFTNPAGWKKANNNMLQFVIKQRARPKSRR